MRTMTMAYVLWQEVHHPGVVALEKMFETSERVSVVKDLPFVWFVCITVLQAVSVGCQHAYMHTHFYLSFMRIRNAYVLHLTISKPGKYTAKKWPTFSTIRYVFFREITSFNDG